MQDPWIVLSVVQPMRTAMIQHLAEGTMDIESGLKQAQEEAGQDGVPICCPNDLCLRPLDAQAIWQQIVSVETCSLRADCLTQSADEKCGGWAL